MSRANCLGSGMVALVLACGSPGGNTSAGGTTTGVTSLVLTEGTTGTTEAPRTTSATGFDPTGGMTGTSATTTGVTTTATRSSTTMAVETDTSETMATSGTEPPQPCMQGEVVCED